GRIRMHGRWLLDQWAHQPPRLLDAVLAGEPRAVAVHRSLEQDLVGRRAFAAFLGELHVKRDLLGPAAIGAMCIDDQPDAGNRIELDHELALHRQATAARHDEPEAWRPTEHEPYLGLRHRQALAGADEPGHASPAPVV